MVKLVNNKRRKLLQFLGVGAGGLAFAGCAEKPSTQRYNQADIDLLIAQQNQELSRAGQGHFGAHRYAGYQGLAELPWFEINRQGQLTLVAEDIPSALDMHCHLGMSVLFRPHLDLLAASARTQHLLDCDAESNCDLDLDVYANSNFSEAALDNLNSELRAQGLWGSKFAATQTIPNLISEMDNMRVAQAVLLPIKLGLWFGDDLSEQWSTAVAKSSHSQRLICGCSVHPRNNQRHAELEAHAARGVKIVKLHPTVQRFYPDDPSLLELYEKIQSLGMAVFFHGGRAGIEPGSSHPYAMPRHYQAALANFPKLNFILGHAGARDYQAMMALAAQHSNAWIGIHGQSISNLDALIEQTGGTRLLFGTDWPFYHIGMSLAKVLITTDTPKRRALRASILRANAQALLAQLGA